MWQVWGWYKTGFSASCGFWIVFGLCFDGISCVGMVLLFVLRVLVSGLAILWRLCYLLSLVYLLVL